MPNIFNKPNADFVKEVHKWFKDSQTKTSDWRTEARESYQYYAGAQWDEQDASYLREMQRPIVTFNRVAPIIDSVSGAEIQNRQETRYLPRSTSSSMKAPDHDGKVSEMYNEAGRWVRDLTEADDEESESFIDLLITGMAWTETFVDFEQEADGQIRMSRVSPLDMYWDPDSRKKNLGDGRYVIRVKNIHKTELKEMFPGKRIAVQGPGFNVMEPMQPHDANEAKFYVNDQGGRAPENDELTVAQVQWWERRPFIRVLNPNTGVIEELTPKEYALIEDFIPSMMELNPDMPEPVRQMRREYFQAFLVGSTILKKEQLQPSDDGIIPGFTLQPMTGKRDEGRVSSRSMVAWYGLMRAAKDPQSWANKFFSMILDIINSNAKGGLIAEAGVFEDPRKAEDLWSRSDSIVFVQQGALSGEKPRLIPKPVAGIPSGLAQMMQFAIGSIRDTMGVNIEFLGAAERTQSGVVEAGRVRQGMAVLSVFFNSLRRYRKNQGRILLYFMRKYIPDGTMVRVVGEERFVKFWKDPDVAKFDVIVDEAPTSANQKSEVWFGLQQLLPALVKAGLPIPPEVIDFLPLPQSVIIKFKQFYASKQPSKEQQQVQKQQMILALQQAMADIEKTKSEAAKNMATADSNVKARALDREKAQVETTLAKDDQQIELLKVLIETLGEDKDNVGSQ